MRLKPVTIAIVAATALLAGEAGAQPSTQWRDCTGNSDASLDQQIASCTAVIRAAGTPKRMRTIATYNRGIAYRDRGDNDRAIADLGATIRRDAGFAAAHAQRGLAFLAKGDRDRAIADEDTAIRLDPKAADAYLDRGAAHLLAGAPARARADLARAAELNPGSADAALWLDLAEHRDGREGRLAQAAQQLDMTAWPAPVVGLMLGRSSLAETLAAAESPDPRTRQRRACTAQFHGGELALRQGARDEAARLFRLAAGDCPPGTIERDSAEAGLAGLGAAR